MRLEHSCYLLGALFLLSFFSIGCGSIEIASSTSEVSNQPTQVVSVPATQYVWNAPTIGSSTSLGKVQLQNGGTNIDLLAPQVQFINVGNSFHCTAVSATSITSGQSLVETFASSTTTLHITVSLSAQGKELEVTLAADTPLVQQVDFGLLAANFKWQPIPVPYYSNPVFYVTSQNVFVNSWWDWHDSSANGKNKNALIYNPSTDGTRHNLHESFALAVSATLNEVLPQIDNPASPNMVALSGQPIIDIWGSADFTQVRDDLMNLNDYGIGSCVYLIHNWQNKGYDNGLPGHYPANPSFGGSIPLAEAVSAGRQNGCIVGVHQNYQDYYPNYAGFTTNALAVDSNGSFVPTYVNPEGIQAHETKPTWMIKSAQSQSPEIHALYNTDASFLDVNSAIHPWARTDLDANAPGEGTSSSWLTSTTQLWSYERNVESGPIFGEGSEHWYYSGLLDGVEAQTGAGNIIPGNVGPSLPLFVDFDLLHIHPLQVNHGMGYYERWNPTATTQMSSVQMDQYRMQEIIFGHAPYVGTQYWNDVLHATIESRLVGPVAKNYGTALVGAIQYQVEQSWVDSGTAAKAGIFSRVKVDYTNGLEVVANSQPDQLSVDGVILPQYGWVATGPGLIAYTALCGTSLCDYVQSTSEVFANARNPQHTISAAGVAQASVAQFKQTGTRAFVMQMRWQSIRNYSGNGLPFVHFVDPTQLQQDQGTVFMCNDSFSIPMTSWGPGELVENAPCSVQVPLAVADGTYSVRVGIADAQYGNRLVLDGNNDGLQRYIVGDLTISGNGMTIVFTPAQVYADPRLNMAGEVVTFPSLKTDGIVSITQNEGRWVLRSYPRGFPTTILLNTATFPTPSSVQNDQLDNLGVSLQGDYWQVIPGESAEVSWPASPVQSASTADLSIRGKEQPIQR